APGAGGAVGGPGPSPRRGPGPPPDWRPAPGGRLPLPPAASAGPCQDAGERPDADQPAAASTPAVFVPVRPDRELDAAVSEAAAAAAGRPVLVEVAVSVGRTSAEAGARADGEELFALTGHPRAQGLFGTLEECQAAAARLLDAGATELVCYLPRSHDLPDVLAQLRAISIGAGALRPGDPPSAPPPPPPGWRGRRPRASLRRRLGGLRPGLAAGQALLQVCWSTVAAARSSGGRNSACMRSADTRLACAHTFIAAITAPRLSCSGTASDLTPSSS